MVTNDANLIRMKQIVMEKVARLAWEDNLRDYPMNSFSMYRDGHMDEKCLLD